MSEEIKKEETVETNKSKKSWFNRIWSAVTGLVVGAASMFGIQESQVNKLKETVVSIHNDIVEAIRLIKEKNSTKEALEKIEAILENTKSVVQDVSEISEQVKTSNYLNKLENLQTLINDKKYDEFLTKKTEITDELLKKAKDGDVKNLEPIENTIYTQLASVTACDKKSADANLGILKSLIEEISKTAKPAEEQQTPTAESEKKD